ncbi:fatty acid cis/trans isomerase [Marinobacter xestospongiae]|uniref:Fatty acid cis/trans isomerase n=1 Tax=Marinobacter xestospongiae TaxID=994319 RepID=A0ABU3VZI4_9GAMM|nr:fatty acid cis/trans isomerase [Marinobacter xestospongiae]MDV2079576.1 fatty acid cis/trans isomerase [Marinobacter xestospongiae]
MRQLLRLSLTALCLLLVLGCSEHPSQASERQALPAPTSDTVSFSDDVQPILAGKCLACHGCFDAPCQLKLETAEGLVRGAHPSPVYDGGRLETAATTRLGFDASSEAQWRELGFYSVLAKNGGEQSLFERMIRLGKQYDFAPNSKLPEDIALGLARSNQCVSNDEFADYAEDHPLEGMPLAVTGLTDDEYATLTGWLRQGAPVTLEQVTPGPAEQALIQRWESLLNQRDDRHRLVARWLYEHLYLAHLYFPELEGDTRFFQLVRSHTAPGEPIDPVATRRPNDGVEGPFYYRLRPVTGSILHKRHITLPAGEATLARVHKLFFEPDWSVHRLPGYGATERANPFLTFSAIPARARYQFMLDNAEYFVRTFIRGPVCRGQIATDVIRDRFWAIFQDPDKDLYITDAAYRRKATPLLSLPGQDSALLDLGDNWLGYQDMRNRYTALREAAYREYQPDGARLADIWDGDGHNDNALLTIFRHHTSASVQRGLIGQVPLTTWWMDYPLFERTYYELVVNFDVFGNVAHQAQTRLYFDLIRNGAEHSFLRLLPADARQSVLDHWYQGSGQLKFGISYHEVDTDTPSGVTFATDAPRQELGLRLLQRFVDINAEHQDRLNRCAGRNCRRPDQPGWVHPVDRQLKTLANVPAERLAAIDGLPDVTFLRVHNDDGERTVYSLIRDRAHSNVAFMMGESLRYQPEQDRLTLYPGIIGSYPNFVFDLPASQVAEFTRRMQAVATPEDLTRVVDTWGVRRTHPRFWQILHDITAWHRGQRPLEAGIFDINRYVNL